MENEIKVRTAIQLIRARPDMFFREGVPTDAQLIGRVLDDLEIVGDFAARIYRQGQFVAVAADVDWVVPPEGGHLSDLFRGFIAMPMRGANFDRAEVYLAATADGVLAAGRSPGFALNLDLMGVPAPIKAELDTAVRVLVWKRPEIGYLGATP